MSGKTILLVEDEAAIREMTAMALKRAGFEVEEAEDALQAERIVSDNLPDMILLDWMLPGSSGVDLARRFRRDDYTREVPIIMLTARSEEDDRIRGLESGADDYVIKPFSPRELIARIKAVLRRAGPELDEGVIEVDGLRLDTHSHRITIEGKGLDMGPTEFRLLQFFMSHPERVYSRSQLLDMVWSRGSFVEERTVDVHIRRLRKALADEGYDRYIQTVRGAGYRFSSRV
ncbi:MAG: phosphate regulon transcriptional regulator PhoB [Pseudomonadota bacterium]